LAALPNVTVVKADISQPSTLVEVFRGAEAVYALSNFYDSKVQEDTLEEARQGCNMADIAKETGVKLFIWSTVPSAFLRTSAKFDSPRLVENKFMVSQYLKYKKVPHIDLYLGFYMDNWINFGQISKAADGSTIEIAQPRLHPDTKVGMIWVEQDLGRTVSAILDKFQDKPDAILGRPFYCVSAQYSTNDFSNLVKQEIGCDSRVVTPSTSGLKDLDVMYDYYNVWGVYRDVDIPDPQTEELVGKFSSLSDFVKGAVSPFVRTL
jgi:uncharacterized protein YbjT (DUF2867 family)